MTRSKNPVLGALTVGALIALLSLSCQRQDPNAVGTLGGEPIPREDFDAWVATQPEGRTRSLPGESDAERNERLLEEMVIERLVEARVANWEGEPPQPVQAQLEIIDETRRLAEAHQRLAQPRIEVTEEQARSYYDDYPDEFGHNGRLRVRHIFRRFDREADQAVKQAVREELEGFRKQVEDGYDFETLARENSQSETASLGGLIGVIDPGVLDEATDAVLWRLEEGEISKVVETAVGSHVFRVDARLPAERTTFEKARTRLFRRLTRLNTEKAEQELRQELLEASGATYNVGGLGSKDAQTVLFSLEEDSLTLEQWRGLQDEKSFVDARSSRERDLLDSWVLRRLYLWDASRQESSEELEASNEEPDANDDLMGVWMRARVRREALEDFEPELLEGYYEQESARFTTPKLFDLSLIVVPFPEEEGQWYKVFEELELLGDEIRAGDKIFEEEAKRVSTDPSSWKGGEVGRIRLDSFQEWTGPVAQKAVAELALDVVSEPILVERYVPRQLVYERYGYMLVRVNEIVEPTQLSFDEAQERIVDQLVQSAPNELAAEIRSKVLKSAGPEWELRPY